MPRPGPRTTNTYSEHFKATAVRLSELPGVEVQEVARSLYIHPFMLSRWRRRAACASFHCARAARWTRDHAAAQLRRYTPPDL